MIRARHYGLMDLNVKGVKTYGGYRPWRLGRLRFGSAHDTDEKCVCGIDLPFERRIHVAMRTALAARPLI